MKIIFKTTIQRWAHNWIARQVLCPLPPPSHPRARFCAKQYLRWLSFSFLFFNYTYAHSKNGCARIFFYTRTVSRGETHWIRRLNERKKNYPIVIRLNVYRPYFRVRVPDGYYVFKHRVLFHWKNTRPGGANVSFRTGIPFRPLLPSIFHNSRNTTCRRPRRTHDVWLSSVCVCMCVCVYVESATV